MINLKEFQNKNILSIDQSLVCSGISIYFNNEIITTTIEPKKIKGVERLIFIREKIKELLKKYNVSLIIMEGYSFGSRGRAVFDLGELGGMIKILGKDLNIPVITLAPGTHKKFTTGKGNTKKDMMLLEVYKKYNIELNNDNVADSVSLLKTILGYIDYCNEKKGFVKYELEVFTTLGKDD